MPGRCVARLFDNHRGCLVGFRDRDKVDSAHLHGLYSGAEHLADTSEPHICTKDHPNLETKPDLETTSNYQPEPPAARHINTFFEHFRSQA